MTKPEIEIAPDFENRDDQVITLRECGCTYLAIAKQLGLEPATMARKCYLRALKRRSPEEQHILQQRELQRFDALAAHIASRADLGEEAIDQRLATVDRLRYELLNG
jgi:hypothetical protein